MKKALSKHFDELDSKDPREFENVLVVFTTIEKDDDEHVLPGVIDSILRHALQVKANSILIYPFAHLSQNLADADLALNILRVLEKMVLDKASTYNIGVHRAPFGWYKEFVLHAAGHPLSELSRVFEKKSQLNVVRQEEANRGVIVLSSDEKVDELFRNEYSGRFGITVSRESNTISFDKIYSNVYFSILAEINTSCIDRLVQNGDFSKVIDVFNSFFDLKSVNTEIKIGIGKSIYTLNEYEVTINKNIIDVCLPWFYELINDKPELKYFNIITICESQITLRTNSLLLYLIVKEIEKMLYKESTPILPIELSPLQVYIISESEHTNHIIRTISILNRLGINRIKIDTSKRRLGAKIRDAGRSWANIVIIIGKREVSSQSVTIRLRRYGSQEIISIEDLDKYLRQKYPL